MGGGRSAAGRWGRWGMELGRREGGPGDGNAAARRGAATGQRRRRFEGRGGRVAV